MSQFLFLFCTQIDVEWYIGKRVENSCCLPPPGVNLGWYLILWRPPAVHGPPDTGGSTLGTGEGNKLLATAGMDVHETPHLHCNWIWLKILKMRINDYRTYDIIWSNIDGVWFWRLSGAVEFFAHLQVPCRVPSHPMETRCPRLSCSRVTPLKRPNMGKHQGIWWKSRDQWWSIAFRSDKSW